MTPRELQAVLQAGLLSFPLTDFDASLRFAPAAYADRLEWLQPYGASVPFAAGGTGDFFPPYIALRNRGEGYAVSIVKAGATIVGHSAGPVRPPLSDLQPDEFEQLRALIATLGPQ